MVDVSRCSPTGHADTFDFPGAFHRGLHFPITAQGFSLGAILQQGDANYVLMRHQLLRITSVPARPVSPQLPAKGRDTPTRRACCLLTFWGRATCALSSLLRSLPPILRKPLRIRPFNYLPSYLHRAHPKIQSKQRMKLEEAVKYHSNVLPSVTVTAAENAAQITGSLNPHSDSITGSSYENTPSLRIVLFVGLFFKSRRKFEEKQALILKYFDFLFICF